MHSRIGMVEPRRRARSPWLSGGVVVQVSRARRPLRLLRSRLGADSFGSGCRCLVAGLGAGRGRWGCLFSCLGFEESGGAAGDGQPGDGFAVGCELPAGLALEEGAVVAVGEEPFEAVEFGLFLRGALQGVLFGVVPPGAGFGESHGAAGAGVGGDEQQCLAGCGGGPAADFDRELQRGGQAGSGPADRRLAEVCRRSRCTSVA